MYTCFFAGHQDAPDFLQERLNELVEQLVKEHHVTEFITGRFGNFDRMATIAVQRVIRLYPEKEILAYILEPYFPGDREIKVPPYFEDYYYPDELVGVSGRYCVEKANQIALQQSQYLIAYVCGDKDRVAKLYRKAQKMEAKGYIRALNLTAEHEIP